MAELQLLLHYCGRPSNLRLESEMWSLGVLRNSNQALRIAQPSAWEVSACAVCETGAFESALGQLMEAVVEMAAM